MFQKVSSGMLTGTFSPPTASSLLVFQMKRLKWVINMYEVHLQAEKMFIVYPLKTDCLAQHQPE